MTSTTAAPQYIRSDGQSIVIYNEPPIVYRSPESYKQTEKQRNKRHFTGEMSSYTRSKVKKIVNNWVAAITKGQGDARQGRRKIQTLLTFVTLTLSAKQRHSDNEIKRECLNHFLITCQRKFEIENYLWVAEKQKNGNIHFHLVFDKYVHWARIRRIWNQAQDKLGYVQRFEKSHGHSNPNSTDIHRLRSIKRPAAYICKYMTKAQANYKVNGRMWSATRQLAKVEYFRELLAGKLMRSVNQLRRSKKAKVYITDYVTFIYADINEISKELGLCLHEMLSDHYSEVFTDLYPSPS